MEINTFNDYNTALTLTPSARGFTSWKDAPAPGLVDAWTSLYPYVRGKEPFNTDDPQLLDYEVEIALRDVAGKMSKITAIDTLLKSDAWKTATRSMQEGGSTQTNSTLTRSGSETRSDTGTDTTTENGTESEKATRFNNGLNVTSLTATATANEHTEGERTFNNRVSETGHERTETTSFNGRADTDAATVTHGRTQSDTSSETDAGAKIAAIIRSFDFDLGDFLLKTARGLCSSYLGGLRI